MTLSTTQQFASSRQTGEHLLQLGISDFCLWIRTFEKRSHLIRLGPPTLKDKGLNRACTPGDEDLGAILRFCLHTFPYYPIEKFFTFLKFLNFPCGLLPSTPCKHSIVFCLLLRLSCCRTSLFNCQSQEDPILFFWYHLYHHSLPVRLEA